MIKIIFIRHGESTENISGETWEEYDINNVILTSNGIIQAKKTGTYLFETFGKFDCVYSSPKTRCVQTSNIIIKCIGYDLEKIIIDDNIVEIGGNFNPFDGLSKKDKDKIIDSSNNKIKEIQSKLDNPSTNPYDKYELNIKFNKMISKEYKISPNLYDCENNIKNFFNNLKNKIEENFHKKILVVTHGGILQLIQKILCNINPENKIFFSEKPFTKSKELFSNCACLYVGFDITNKKFILISPTNTYHLV